MIWLGLDSTSEDCLDDLNSNYDYLPSGLYSYGSPLNYPYVGSVLRRREWLASLSSGGSHYSEFEQSSFGRLG